LKEGLPPLVVELNLSLFVHVGLHQVEFFVVFVYKVHCISKPSPQVSTFPFSGVVEHHSHESVHLGFHLLNMSRATLDFLNTFFSSLLDALLQDLEE
jgi:hypothetical protein